MENPEKSPAEEEKNNKDPLVEKLRKIQGCREISSFERIKTPEEEKITDSIIKSMPEFLKEYGGEFEGWLDSAHIHFIDVGKLPEEEKMKLNQRGGEVRAACKYTEGKVRVYSFGENVNLLSTAGEIVHELVHMNSYGRVVYVTKKDAFTEEKIGVELRSKDKKEMYFLDLNEAITEVLREHFDSKYFCSILGLESEVEERKKLADKSKCRPQDIVIFSKPVANGWETKISRSMHPDKFDTLIGDIYSKNRQDFSSEEEVFKVFAQAMMSGKLFKMARLIEKTCGKGSFKKLGKETAQKPIENLP